MEKSTFMRWLTAGLCLGLSFTHPVLGPLFIVGTVILIRSIVLSDSWKVVLIGASLAGIFRYGGAIFWVWDTYPIDWLGVASPVTQLALIGLVWLTNAVSMATGMAAIALVIFYLYKRDARYIYTTPLLLALAEVLSSLTFSVWSLGPGSGLDLGFSFGYGGYAVAWIPGILPLATIGGAYALSLFAFLVSLFIYLLVFEGPQYERVGKYLIIVLMIWLTGLNLCVYNRDDKPLPGEIIAMEMRFESSMLTEENGPAKKRTSVLEAVEAALESDPDIILLPEDARFVSSFSSAAEVFDHLNNISSSSNTLLVDSARSTDNGTTVLRAHIFDLETQSYYYLDKQHMVPQGEYIPYWLSFLLMHVGDETLVKKTLTDRSYRPGPMSHYEKIPSDIPSILFCFESVLPTGIIGINRSVTSDLILHPVSHGWFHGSAKLRYQLDRMLRAQAIWNNANIIQAGNMSPSVIYTPDGRLNEGEVVLGSDLYTLKSFR
jgi:apolipoprotein N-acyltransferase